MTKERKRGKLSTYEEKYIRTNCTVKTIAQIAEHLNRTEEPIRKYIDRHNLVAEEMTEDEAVIASLRAKLHSRPYWREVTRQLSDEDPDSELKYFENTWIGIVLQFQENIMATEEQQLKQWIILDILMNRSMRERKAHIETVERLQAALDAERNVPEEEQNKERITLLEVEVSQARGAISSFTTEHTKLLSEMKQISKDLKSTRDQRLKRIEDGKTTWIGLLRELEDERVRDAEGREMELMRMAADKVFNDMSDWHEYADGELDQPILTPENAISEDDDDYDL